MITETEYTALTGEDAPADFAVLLARAVAIAEAGLQRPLSYGTHTETLRYAADGRVFPSAIPVESVEAVEDFAGREWWTPTGSRVTDLYVELGAQPSNGRVKVTYTGGFDVDTAPSALKLGFALAVRTLNSPAATSSIPADVDSYSAGDVSVTRRDGFGADGKKLPDGAESLYELGGQAAGLLWQYRKVTV